MRLGWWLSSEEHDPRALVEHAVAAEEAGFCTAMISDHLQPWGRKQANAAHVWSVLGAIATRTSSLEIGTGVTATVHRNHPINVAHAAATIAVMSEGRFFLGLGAGERLNEQPFGERFPRAGERRKMMEETIDVLRALWSDKQVNHRGKHWSVENLRLETRPAEAPKILVAASGKRSAQLAGTAADGMIGLQPDNHLIDAFHGAGGSFAVAQMHVSIAATIDEARENAWAWWPNGVVPPSVNAELAKPAEFDAIASAIGPSTIAESVVLATDAAPIIAKIDRFIGAGFDTVYLHQVGPDQRRLVDLATGELFAHYGSA